MNDAPGQIRRPSTFQLIQFRGQVLGQAFADLVGPWRAGLEQGPPGGNREIVLPLHREIGAGQVHLGQCLAQKLAVFGQDTARPQPVEEGYDGGGPATESAQGFAVAPMHGRRTMDATAGQMIHEAQEIGQVVRAHPFFIEREDVAACPRAQKVVGILHALGDAVEGCHLAQVVIAEEGLQILVRYLGVDGHRGIGLALGCTGRRWACEV